MAMIIVIFINLCLLAIGYRLLKRIFGRPNDPKAPLGGGDDDSPA